MTPTILVVGSLHYDIVVEADHLPRPDETGVGQRWYPKFGGKGGNQAVSVAHAGGHARMLGAVGDDDFGAFMRARLAAEHVDARFVETLAGVGTGMSVAIIEARGDYAATIVSGANQRILPERIAAAEPWHGVSLLVLQNEVPEQVNLAAARMARSRGVPVLLNAAPARPLSDDFAALVDVLVVNSVEAEMMGAPAVVSLACAGAAAAKLVQNFAKVVVTAGGKGLALAEGQGAPQLLPAEKVDVVSTHGAGDCFIGVLAVELAQGKPLTAACQTASHAAALHVSQAPRRSEPDRSAVQPPA